MIIKAPVIHHADLLVIGGTLRAVNTALKLRKQGFKVFCATAFSYFGEDLCATLDLFSPKSEDYLDLFGTDATLHPMKIKYTLDQALIDAEIDHLFHIVESLKAEGTSFIFISHKMPEIFRIADRYTVTHGTASLQVLVVDGWAGDPAGR